MGLPTSTTSALGVVPPYRLLLEQVWNDGALTCRGRRVVPGLVVEVVKLGSVELY